jgi:hypothetical protein
MSGQSAAYGRPTTAQLSSKKRIFPREPELRVPIYDSDSDSEHRRSRHKKRGCCQNVNTQTSILFLMAFMLTILAVLLIIVVVSVYGPAGKVQNTITTVSEMVAKVNNSGLADVVVAVVNNWQVGNHTQQTFTLLNALYESGGQVTDIVMAIEPTMVKELANRTSITVGGLLALAETIINNQGIDIVRFLLACLMFLTRVCLRRSRCIASG